MFKFDQGLVLPTRDRIQSLFLSVQKVMNGMVTVRHYMEVLGKMAFCLELIPNARLFMRPVQLHLLRNWTPSKMSLDFQIQCIPNLKVHLKWWLSLANIMQGRSLKQNQTSVTITTDASKSGWGGHMNNLTAQGLWTEEQKLLHINNLELEAVFLTVKKFQKFLKNKLVLIRSDNVTVVQYINKQGGTRSLQLCQRTWDLWMFALENKIYLKAAHIAGVNNVLADQLSRIKIQATEWELDNSVVHQFFQIWGHPTIDLFATNENKKSSCVLLMDESPTSISSGCSIHRMEQHVCQCIPPPLSTNSKYFTAHAKISVRDNTDSSTLAKTTLVSPVVTTTSSLSSKTSTSRKSAGSGQEKSGTSEPRSVSVNCMATIEQQLKTKGFSENARKLLSASWRAGTQKDYKAKFRKYNSWCSERDIDPYTASLENCANFLTHLFDKGLQYRTIAGYRSMLSSVLSPIEKIPVCQHPYIIRLLKGVFNTRPPKRKLVPEWDLPLVLG